MQIPVIGHFIGGHYSGPTVRDADAFNPNTGHVRARVVLGGSAEIEAAVTAARTAQPAWKACASGPALRQLRSAGRTAALPAIMPSAYQQCEPLGWSSGLGTDSFRGRLKNLRCRDGAGTNTGD
jgi:hypothetical protein